MFFPFILTQGGSGGPIVYTLPAASGQGTKKDKQQIFKKVVNSTTFAMKCVDAGTASGSYGTDLDEEQVWKAVYDETADAIRVVVVASSGGTASKLQYNEAIKDSFDPTQIALRVITGLDAKTIPEDKLDGPKCWQMVHDQDNHGIRATVPAAGGGATYGTNQDMKQIWKKMISTSGEITVVGEP